MECCRFAAPPRHPGRIRARAGRVALSDRSAAAPLHGPRRVPVSGDAGDRQEGREVDHADSEHDLAGDRTIDPDKFETETLAELGMPAEIVMRHRTPQFSHIFADDGYSAGYYSYLWSDALTADAAEVFEEAGSYYNPELARSLYDNIMSVGDTIDPAEGFERFRGRPVDTGALLRKRGFPVD